MTMRRLSCLTTFVDQLLNEHVTFRLSQISTSKNCSYFYYIYSSDYMTHACSASWEAVALLFCLGTQNWIKLSGWRASAMCCMLATGVTGVFKTRIWGTCWAISAHPGAESPWPKEADHLSALSQPEDSGVGEFVLKSVFLENNKSSDVWGGVVPTGPLTPLRSASDDANCGNIFISDFGAPSQERGSSSPCLPR